MRKIKNGLILAGGDSSRFWPLREKLFYSFLGKPLIMYQVEQLSQYCEKIFIVASNTNAIMIDRLLDNFDLKQTTKVVVQKETAKGQAGAILAGVGLVSGEVLIINANDVVESSVIEKLIKSVTVAKEKIFFVGKKRKEYFPGAYFRFSNKNEIMEIIEKPAKDQLPSQICKLVIDYFPDFSLLIKAIKESSTNRDDLYEQAIDKLLKSPIGRDYLPYEGFWQSLKYSWDVLSMTKLFLSNIKESRIAKSAQVSKLAKIVGPVAIGENVKIGDFAKIVGPCYIDNNTIIGDYSMVRESHIGEDCLVGSFSEIARSYVGNSVFLHRNYVGDSVLSDSSSMGAGAVTANLRFDGENVQSNYNDNKVDTNLAKLGAIIGSKSKIGVNATLIPGVKVGANCLVGPTEIVRFDLEDKTLLIKGEERINTKI